MKGREQKISERSETCPDGDRTASEGHEGGQTYMRITENNLTSNHDHTGNGLLEQILSPMNLNAAYKQVRRNKGSGGVDRMDVGSLKDYLVREKEELIISIERGKYCPNPVRRAEIPKENGKRRGLGIPTVV